jgi:hypothetical protein
MAKKRFHRGEGGGSISLNESHSGGSDSEHYKKKRRGAEPASRGMGREHYAGMEPRRRQEMEDAGMIHEDHSAIANLPQNVMIKKYPEAGPYMPEGLDDTIAGVDRQMDYDDGKRKANMYPKKV